jgi:hypothetical protein
MHPTTILSINTNTLLKQLKMLSVMSIIISSLSFTSTALTDAVAGALMFQAFKNVAQHRRYWKLKSDEER